MVAKSYQNLAQVGDPFVKNNRNYVYVKTLSGSTRAVRWYSEQEYEKLYPGELAKRFRSLKDVLGFEKGYITIFKGNTYNERAWLKDNGARYHNLFGWYIVSELDVPEEMPQGIEPLQLKYEDVFVNENQLLPDETIKTVIERMTYEPDESEYVGEVGERIEVILTIEKVITLNGYYGTSWMHIMRDELRNVYVWTTATRCMTEGRTVDLKGTIKDHKEYRNTKQTILTRCKVISKEDE